jgi:TMEM175 potassium channel family protein
MTTASGQPPADAQPADTQPADGLSPADGRPPEAQATAAEVEAAVAERTIFFSDAVVAIAITLLALALPLPTGGNTTDMLHSLSDHSDAYIAFLISFVVIGNHWNAHRQLFRYVDHLDTLVTKLNMLWLLMMVITPFATRLLSGSGPFGIRFGIYALVQAFASTCLLLMTREVQRARLMRPGAPEDAGTDRIPNLIVIIALFLISVPVSFSFVSRWAYLCWVAIPLAMRVQNRYLARRAAEQPAGEG